MREIWVSKYEVLELIAGRTETEKTTSLRGLSSHLDLSLEAARNHLSRLWEERLIEITGDRKPSYRNRLMPGERFRELRFVISRRGLRRLSWYLERGDSP